jgi:hypothetical protein
MIPDTASVDELGLLLNITRQQVNNLVAQNVLRRVGRGKFELASSVQAFVRYREGLIERKMAGGPLAVAKLRKLQADASISEMNMRERKGELAPVSAVERVISAAVVTTKQRLLAFPSRLAPRLAPLKTAAEAQALLRKEIETVLVAISSVFNDAAERLPKTKAGNGEDDDAKNTQA